MTGLVVLLEGLERAQDVAIGQDEQPLRRGLRHGAATEVWEPLPRRAAIARERDRVGDGHQAFGLRVVGGAVDRLVERDDDREQAPVAELGQRGSAQIPSGRAHRVERPTQVVPRRSVIFAAQESRATVGALAARAGAEGEHDPAIDEAFDPGLAGVPDRVVVGRLPDDAAPLDRDRHPTAALHSG